MAKTTTTRQLTVRKVTEKELDTLREFLIELNAERDILLQYDEDDEQANKDIAKLIRDKFPQNAALIAPINLDTLLNKFQDKESSILQMPKWIVELYDILESIERHISINPENSLADTEIFKRIKEINAQE